MDVLFAVTQFEAHGLAPPFELAPHPPLPPRGEPFGVRLPKIYLPWDARRGIIALRRPHSQLAICRCGFVLAGIYVRVDRPTELQVPVALKVMDRAQVLLQRDDVESEVRVMGLLQMAGVDAPLANPHVVRWEYAADEHNQYIATEFVANGSLVSYAHARIRQLMVQHLEDFMKEHGEGPSKLECISYVYRGCGHEWMRESLRIFLGVMRALTYLHAQGVAHLDLDIYNIAIDKSGSPRIIDLGSGQVMDHRGVVGAGDVGIKCKPMFVAPEVRRHSRKVPPRPGFDGASADMWAAGVVLVQCIVWGFRGGPAYLTANTNWRREVFTHIDAGCDPKSCHLCLNFISIPPLIGAILKQLLHPEPHKRPSAYEVAMALQENRQLELFPPHPYSMRG